MVAYAMALGMDHCSGGQTGDHIGPQPFFPI